MKKQETPLAVRASALKLSPIQKRVLMALCEAADETGQCERTMLDLAEDGQAHHAIIQRAVVSLEALGYLSREKRPKRPTLFTITLPDNPQ